MRIGTGFDLHPFAPGNKLVLGGVEIPHEMGLTGHSDSDVLSHSICDAIFGAMGMGDITEHFPDTFAEFEGVSSESLLKAACGMMRANGYEIGNIDCNVFVETPNLYPYRAEIRQKLAATLEIDPQKLNIKSSYAKGLGFVGNHEGAIGMATVLLIEAEKKEL